MLLRILITFMAIYCMSTLTFAQNVGINTTDPIYKVDIRGTDDQLDGGDLQIATPSMSNFLRFFGGRTNDANPFMAFHDLDTFHIATTLPDFSTYTRRMTMLPTGKLGLGTDNPNAELDIRTFASDDGAEIHLGNSNASHFLRMFSGKPTNPRPSIFWNFGSVLDFALFDGNVNYEPILSLDGKRIHVLNNNGSVFLGENAGLADNGNRNTAVGSFSLRNNVTGVNNTVLGYGAGNGNSNVGVSFSGNVLIGHEAGFNITDSDRLYIENSSSSSPLIYGEFDNDLIRINGKQEITGSLDLNHGITSGVALRINGEEALWSNGSYFSYGFGTNLNYFAKPMRIGPVEGSTTPYADLHVVDNSGVSNISIESYGHDAVLQLAGNTDDPNTNWTMRRRSSDGHLEWKHNNLSFMRLTTAGRLGLGVSSPQKTMEIAGDTRIFKSLNTATGASTDNYIMTIENTSNDNSFRNSGLEIKAGQDAISANGLTRSKFIGFIKPNGSLIGAISQLDNNQIAYYVTSDERLKKDIRPTSLGLATLMTIGVKDYRWKDDDENVNFTTGFIAQELQKAFPVAARVGGDDPKMDPWQIAPVKLIPLMVKSIQDQQHIIEALKTENKELTERLERIEKMLGLTNQ